MKHVFKVVLHFLGVAQDDFIYTVAVAAFNDVQARELAVKHYTQVSQHTESGTELVEFCTVEHVLDLDLDIEKLPAGFRV